MARVASGEGSLSQAERDAFATNLNSLDRVETVPVVWPTKPASTDGQATVASAPPSGLGTKIMIGAGVLGLAAWWWTRRKA